MQPVTVRQYLIRKYDYTDSKLVEKFCNEMGMSPETRDFDKHAIDCSFVVMMGSHIKNQSRKIGGVQKLFDNLQKSLSKKDSFGKI